MTETIHLLDELAANAWPAIVQQELEGWRLRAAEGVTRRANSVLTAGPTPEYGDWLQLVEEFYRRRGLPSRFQVSPASPPDLDDFLEGQGYVFDAETTVMVASTKTVCESTQLPQRFSIELQPAVSIAWLDAFLHVEGFPESRRSAYQGILGAIGPAACFVLLKDGAQPVGVGLAAAERGWAGLFCIAVAEQYRRQGAGLQIVLALADWALRLGADELYLQVGAANMPAVTLYKRLGFSPLYSYHYREKALT